MTERQKGRIERELAGLSPLYLAVDGKLVGAIGVEDPLKADVACAVQQLRDLGFGHIIMLTGDMAAERLAATLRLFDELVFALAKAVDVKDAYTRGHSERVAQYSREMARRAGDTGERLDSIYSVGLLHDIGKIGIPVTIINKTTRLTDEEYAVIKAHTTMGADILDMVKEFPELSVGARSHHERWDGKGYPDGLAGKAIPRMARIISVADAYDAMTSRRSYRNALPQDESMSDRELFDHLNWYVEGVEMR